MMRIIIEGIGGVGGVLAARIIKAGHRPLLITGNSVITETINGGGGGCSDEPSPCSADKRDRNRD